MTLYIQTTTTYRSHSRQSLVYTTTYRRGSRKSSRL